MQTSDKMLVGAALGTLIGSLAVIMLPKNNRKQLLGKTKNAADFLMEEASQRMPYFRRQNPHKFFWSGSALGALLGAGTALILAPKSGRNLRTQLVNTYNDIADKTHEVLEMIQPASGSRTVQNTAQELVKKAKKKIKPTRNRNADEGHRHASHSHHKGHS